MRWTAALAELERGLLQRDVAVRALLLAVSDGEFGLTTMYFPNAIRR